MRDESNIKHLNLSILYWVDEPLEHLTLKTNRKYAQENYRTAGNRKPIQTLKFIEGERIMFYSSSLRGKQRRDISKKNLLGEKCDALILRFMR